ncbi:M24 family metallopeptidase [Thermoflexus hugenholtzii]
MVLDAGVTWGGYFANVTGTVRVGEPAGEQRRVFEIVLEAQSETIGLVRHGMRAEGLDRVAMGVIACRGRGPYCITRDRAWPQPRGPRGALHP